MPPQLQSPAIECAVETVGYLREVLQYTAPRFANHGWARMCMYRVADAMDTIGRFVDEIAVELERVGAERRTIRRLLKADGEHLRTAHPTPVAGLRLTKRGLRVMPEWLVHKVWESLAFVMLRLPVMLRSSVQPRNALWPGRCLSPMIESMDRLGQLANLFATVHVDVLDEHMLARYQQLFQQRPRVNMPSPEGHRALRLGGWGNSMVGPEHYEVRLLVLLAMLNERHDQKWWMGGNGELHPQVRNAAVGTLNAVEIELEMGDASPRHRLTDGEWAYAQAISAALRGRLALAVPSCDEPLVSVVRNLFDRAPAGIHL
ncbi:hypothetical protein [Streptacidiphilus sp. BW17]|uniref:hypothetical protein n=1 Tax=Streptacidiphilus sp. BW17 TaxID=3156274 RepID=UPI003510F5F0